MKIYLLRFFSLAFCLSLAGCKPPIKTYQMDVRQGNYVTQEMVSQLKPKMTKDDVQKVMGTAMLKHVMQPERWDYYYSLQPGDGSSKKEKHFTVYFKNDRLSHLEGDWEAASNSGTS